MPITDHSAGLWGYLKSVEEEKIHNRVTRFYLWVRKKDHIWAIQGVWVRPELKLDSNFSDSHVE